MALIAIDLKPSRPNVSDMYGLHVMDKAYVNRKEDIELNSQRQLFVSFKRNVQVNLHSLMIVAVC